MLNLIEHTRIYDLEHPRYFGAPIYPAHAPGYVYTLHRHHEPGTPEARTGASGFMYTTEHSGTHIDALCHQAENLHLYGGLEVNVRTQTSTGFTELGAETIAPILARGVLLDVATHLGIEPMPIERPITRRDLEETANSQGVSIGEGDVVLVRMGNAPLWHNPEAYLRSSGVSADGSQWLADRKVRAVGADNMTWDVPGAHDPDLNVTLPGHVILLVRHGIYIIENLNLEDLAQDKRYDFTFICLPLKLRGATGSPVRPIAIAAS
ncbi:MAG TPA: cyclase family protein [Ktedonosporobacter sp.]|nr:cyclase family protein [Ktedonosporobacter sp.]